jgi:hypothetical protein
MTIDEVAEAAANAPSWDARIAVIRLVPERFGTAAQQEVYAAIARRVYVPNLAPDFAYVHWRDEYELQPLQNAYARAVELTNGFTAVERTDLQRTILSEPTTLRVFRLILGFTAPEFAAASARVGEVAGTEVSIARVRSMEAGRATSGQLADCCALVIDLAMKRQLFGESPTQDVRLRTDKPDTQEGWETVRRYASTGVPFPVFLHQRLYGGAFRQLLDATSSRRGDVLEDAVDDLFSRSAIPFVRTGSNNQEEIAERFSLTVRPAPDFVVFDRTGTLRAMLECKAANDGGTARDKAARFRALRAEASRLGGVPVFAVLAGLGWTRAADALGPVVRETDGRVFTMPTLPEMLTVQPFPTLLGTR